MKFPLLRTLLLAAGLTARLAAQDAAPAPDQTPIAEPPPSPAAAPLRTPEEQKKLEDAIRLRLAEHALKKAQPAVVADPAAKPATDAPPNATPPDAAKQDPTMLMPRVEVNQSRVTELAIALQDIDREIAREKKNIKPSALDESLNDPDVAHKLAILGGSSSEDRSRLAEERVSLLEAERDLTEQIFASRTDADRAELQKQLNELKTMRRELERAPKDERK